MGFFYLNLNMVVIKQGDSVEKVDKELLKFAEKAKKEKVKRLEPYFGILKDIDIDPLQLQKQWRSEWE